jgi:hypothetical protein
MPRAGVEGTIPVFERAKKLHALDRAATVIGLLVFIRSRKDYEGSNRSKNSTTILTYLFNGHGYHLY